MGDGLSWRSAALIWFACGVVGICFSMTRRSKREMAVVLGAFREVDPIVAALIFLWFILVSAVTGPAGLGVAFYGWLGRGHK